MNGQRDAQPAPDGSFEELTAFLKPDQTWNRVRFGKINLDGADTEAFRNANEEWLGMVEGVPFNILYVDGTPRTSFAGSGVARLENRLRTVVTEGDSQGA